VRRDGHCRPRGLDYRATPVRSGGSTAARQVVRRQFCRGRRAVAAWSAAAVLPAVPAVVACPTDSEADRSLISLSKTCLAILAAFRGVTPAASVPGTAARAAAVSPAMIIRLIVTPVTFPLPEPDPSRSCGRSQDLYRAAGPARAPGECLRCDPARRPPKRRRSAKLFRTSRGHRTAPRRIHRAAGPSNEHAKHWAITGPAGPTGPMGATGATGLTGTPGATGPQGAAGTNGAPGTNGVDGAKGEQGVAGTNGIDGATGPQGTPGTNGVNGPPGPKGDTGAKGPQGVAGPAGPQGPSGNE
jgi:collagen triple helix repeat protein